MKKFFFDCGTRDVTASVGILALRVMTGSMMLLGHGIPKLRQFSSMKDNFPVPDFFPFSHMSHAVSLGACLLGEALAAVLVILGLATRPAAFLLGFTMVVAAFNILHDAPWFLGPDAPMAREPALLFLIPMISIIFSGAGAYSFDAGLYREGKRRRW
jgi:putative oxidoreductase